jgi:hypothetical protein
MYYVDQPPAKSLLTYIHQRLSIKRETSSAIFVPKNIKDLLDYAYFQMRSTEM